MKIENSPTWLHVGCGPKHVTMVPRWFVQQGWRELRLDINPKVKPDIVGSMTDMPDVPTGSVDAVFSSHNLEHLEFSEIPKALKEFHRVLKDDGGVVLTCPDLQAAAEFIAQGKLFDTVYESPAGSICAFDMVFGYRYFTGANPYMSHRSGFTLHSLCKIFQEMGFKGVYGFRGSKTYDLWFIASKTPASVETLQPMLTEISQSLAAPASVAA